MRHGRSLTPGSVYHTTTFAGPWNTIDCPYTRWQRVTDPDAPHPGAQKYLPNQINTVILPSMDRVVAAEVCVEMWGGHAGSSGKRIRINGGEWMDLGEPELGVSEIPEAYQYFRYPVLDLDPAILLEGKNTFEVTCGPQRYNDFGWGQWGIYGVSFRTYLNASHAGLKADISAVAVGEGLLLEALFNQDPGMVERIDFIGLYEDFDHHGEGSYRDWHYRLRYGERLDMLATTAAYPHRTRVDTTWIPKQRDPSRLVAVVTDYTGVSAVTDTVHLAFPSSNDIQMITPTEVPASWQTRDGQRHSCVFPLDVDPATLESARLVLATWNGFESDSLELNGEVLAPRIGRDHDFHIGTIEVPASALREGRNVFSTYSKTQAHGIEVLWPGPVLKTMSKSTQRRKSV